METVDVMILGGGIAGLGAALKARELGRQAVIFEAAPSAGGLLDNFVVDGYRFDNAVHLSFATEPKVREIFDRTPYHTHPADSLCYEQGRWLKHPVQNNLFPLPAQERVELIDSFLKRPDNLRGDDYEAWLRHQYGDAIAERYPIRYTRKYWATEATQLSTTWIGNRMRRAETHEILFGAMTADTPNTYYTKEMRYPKAGGYKAFIEPLIEQSEIRTSSRATKIDHLNKTVAFGSGEIIKYNQLVSSLPLPVSVGMMPGVPGDVAAAAQGLVATSIDLVSIGFTHNRIKDLWFYIYDEEILASRAYSPSVKSPANAPERCSSLQFEIYSRGVTGAYSADEAVSNTLAAVEKMKIASSTEIAVTHHKRLPYGNVVFDIGMEESRRKVLEFMRLAEVKSVGRFGQWDYLWSNQSLLSGYGWDDKDKV